MGSKRPGLTPEEAQYLRELKEVQKAVAIVRNEHYPKTRRDRSFEEVKKFVRAHPNVTAVELRVSEEVLSRLKRAAELPQPGANP